VLLTHRSLRIDALPRYLCGPRCWSYDEERIYTHSFAFAELNDFYRFSAATNSWTALSPSSSAPSARLWLGLASTPDGMLYLFGGVSSSGTEGMNERQHKG
jgi:hypothetical protein